MHSCALRRALSCVVLLGVASCAAGEDTTSGDDPEVTGSADAGAHGDAGHAGHDASLPSNPSDDSGASGGDDDAQVTTGDAGGDGQLTIDAGHDGGQGPTAPDAAGAHDAASPDGGTDSSVPDGGASDASPVTDASVLPDASDASPTDSGAISDTGAVGPTFGSPLQIDVSAILTIDTVASSAGGGATTLPSGALTPMDGSGYDFYTAPLGTAHSVSGGLPATGFFPANGTQSPDVQLHFTDTSAGANSLLLNGPAPNAGQTFTFAVPPHAYTQLQIYGTSSEGTSALSIVLAYDDASTGAVSITIPDWGTNAASAPVFVLAGGLGRLGTGTFEGHSTFALYGANLGPSTTKALVSVTVTHSGKGRFVFYGATAW